MKQDHKVIREEDICSFCKCADLNVKHSTVMSVIYHDKMNTIEQASTIFLMRNFIQLEWNILVRVGQLLGWPFQQVTKSRQANERPELFWPSFPIQWALTAKSRSLPVSYDEKCCVVQTQVRCDFRQFQLIVRIRAWGLIKGKAWGLIQDKCHFSWRVTRKLRKGDFLTLWRDIQLDTSWY